MYTRLVLQALSKYQILIKYRIKIFQLIKAAFFNLRLVNKRHSFKETLNVLFYSQRLYLKQIKQLKY